MPVFIIVVWEIPIWLLVLAGLCVLGVSAYVYIPFLIALVSISVSASSTLEKRNAAQPVGLKKGLRWVFTMLMSFNVSSAMFYGMQYYVQKISGDIIGRAFSFIEMGVNNIPVFIGVSFFCVVLGKLIGEIGIGSYLTFIVPIVFYFALKGEDMQESNQCKQIIKDYLLQILAMSIIMICISIGW